MCVSFVKSLIFMVCIQCVSFVKSLIFMIIIIPIKIICILWNLYIQVCSAVLSLITGRPIRKRVVGIFSREGKDSYHFLYEALRFQDVLVQEVRTFTITNNGWSEFHVEVSQCDFAILYHSKNRGRLNITDVTDSIYDKELEHLSQVRGKENVLVVADDLDSTTQEDKERILNSQPLIQNKARDLILFRKDKNTSNEETREKIMKIISHIGRETQPTTIYKEK